MNAVVLFGSTSIYRIIDMKEMRGMINIGDISSFFFLQSEDSFILGTMPSIRHRIEGV